jgi:hypothetical protein
VTRWRRRTTTASVIAAEEDDSPFADPARGYGGGSGRHKP